MANMNKNNTNRGGLEANPSPLPSDSFLYDFNVDEWWIPLSSDTERKLDDKLDDESDSSSESETKQEVLEKNDTSKQAKQKQVIAEVALAEQSEIEQPTASESSKPSEPEKDELQPEQEQQEPLETAKLTESEEPEEASAKTAEATRDADPAEQDEAERKQAIAYARKGKMAYYDFSEDGKYLRDNNMSKREIDSRREGAIGAADRVAYAVDAMYDYKGMYAREVFKQERLKLVAKENPKQAELFKTMDDLKDIVASDPSEVWNVVSLYEVRKKVLKADAKLERLDGLKEKLDHDKQLSLFKRMIKFNWLTKQGRANRLERVRDENELDEEVSSGKYAQYQKISQTNKEICDKMLGLSDDNGKERQDKMAMLDKMVTLIDQTNTRHYDQKVLDDPDFEYGILLSYKPRISIEGEEKQQLYWWSMLDDWCGSREGQMRRDSMTEERRDQFVRNVVKNTDWRLA